MTGPLSLNFRVFTVNLVGVGKLKNLRGTHMCMMLIYEMCE